MGRPIHRVYEIIDEQGIAVQVGLCRWGEEPATRQGEIVRWIMGRIVPLSEATCRLIVRDRIRQISEYAGDPHSAPDWLRSPLPIPPTRRGRGRGRPVVRINPDGQHDYFPSVSAASKASGYQRIILHRRLLDGRPDSSGCQWRDAEKCNPHPISNCGEKVGGSC